MSFEPSDFSVKEAIKKLPGLGDGELAGLYEAELAGRNRVSLLRAITSARDELREDAPAAPPLAPAAENPRIERRPGRPGAAAAAYIKVEG